MIPIICMCSMRQALYQSKEGYKAEQGCYVQVRAEEEQHGILTLSSSDVIRSDKRKVQFTRGEVFHLPEFLE